MSRTTLITKFQTMVVNEPGPLALGAKGPTTLLELHKTTMLVDQEVEDADIFCYWILDGQFQLVH